MLKIKNTKHLDTAEEIFTEFLDKFQKYAAEAAEISKGKGNLSPADIFAIRTDVEPQEISREEALKMGALMQGMSDESPLRAIEAGK